MAEIIEEFISGFCRTSNLTRTVECEYECLPDGKRLLTSFECNYEKCLNSSSCLIYQQARELEQK